MGVEWEVAAVDRKIVVHGQFELFVKWTRVAGRGVPEEPMVDNQEIYPLSDCHFEGDSTGIDRGADFRDLAIVLQLEPVVGTRKVRYFDAAGGFIAEGNDFIQGDHADSLGIGSIRARPHSPNYS